MLVLQIDPNGVNLTKKGSFLIPGTISFTYWLHPLAEASFLGVGVVLSSVHVLLGVKGEKAFSAL